MLSKCLSRASTGLRNCVAGIKRGREHARKQGAREEEEKRNLLSSFFPLLARPRISTFPSPLKRVPRRLEGTEITRCHGKHTQNVKYVQSGLPYTTHASHKSQQRCLNVKANKLKRGTARIQSYRKRNNLIKIRYLFE